MHAASDPVLAGDTAPSAVAVADRSPADQFMRRLLRIPDGRTATAQEAHRLFQKSLLISTIRCTLMYVVLPFVLPAVGIAQNVGPAVGFVIGVLAIVAIIYSIRRFWRADHSKRWHYTVFGTTVIAFLVYLAVHDVAELLS